MRLEAVQVDIGLVKDLQEPVVHVHAYRWQRCQVMRTADVPRSLLGTLPATCFSLYVGNWARWAASWHEAYLEGALMLSYMRGPDSTTVIQFVHLTTTHAGW